MILTFDWLNRKFFRLLIGRTHEFQLMRCSIENKLLCRIQKFVNKPKQFVKTIKRTYNFEILTFFVEPIKSQITFQVLN